MRTVTASDANRQFSSVLREVAHGEVITVVSRGKPVAIISPAKVANMQRSAAKMTLLNRLNGQKITGARHWSRDDLYES